MDSAKLVLDANKGTLRALAFCSSLAGTSHCKFSVFESNKNNELWRGRVAIPWRLERYLSNDATARADFRACDNQREMAVTMSEGLRMLVGIGVGMVLGYLLPHSQHTGGALRPRIITATYASPRNGRWFDVSTPVRAQCEAGVTGCIVGCNNDLAGDPDVGQGKTCEVHYRCGDNPPRTLRMPEGRPEWIRCD